MADLLSREYEVNYGHIDNRGIAKPSFLWLVMQDAATVHAEAAASRPQTELHILWGTVSRMRATSACARLLPVRAHPLRNLVLPASAARAGTAALRSLRTNSWSARPSPCG